ncbi:hypothetical protein D0863_02824 [Hortaea werneckii]|uniref:Uncharacterized protein n=1 Tax=Hortaea werneckii TaxID=91943 RepID=A0A3M7EF40_HORWE|nr:hypothetical protein D0863_02824 [Hortaea werneckii]
MQPFIMEAVAALGVAAASVQFLDFALQALALCRQIRDDAQGATATNKELESYSQSLEGLSKWLKSGQADNACGRRIKAVAQACIAKTEELLKLLEKVRKAGSNSRTAAAKTLFRSLKERREIEKLQNELKEKQALLDSALIQDIQRRFDLGTVKQDENFTSLKQSVQDLVNRLQAQDTAAHQNHAETQHKLTNLAKDSQELRAITVAGHSKTVQRLDQIYVDMGKGFDDLKMSDAKEELLRSLFYPEHAVRREMVRPPWSDTFDWVFDETFKSTAYWSCFPAWLKCGSSLYWITGKPASGKSTLMAHIFHDRRTKSISGLLRSLVMQLAEEIPEVAPAILGGLHLRLGRMPTWSERGLTDALRLALTATKDVYLFFLLDGLDEFDGPYGELVDLIFEMKDSKKIKFCVSSRREAGLANRLCQYDHLGMEDLNFKAIRTYAQDKLSLVTDGKALSQTIARRSQGVFLWAVLTTQSLVYGALECSEDVDMLHRRLESTPDEMTQLFGQILATVDSVHKEQLYIWMRLLSRKVVPTVAELTVMQMPGCGSTYDALSAACERTKNHVHYFSKGLLWVDVRRFEKEPDVRWHLPKMTRGFEGISSENLKSSKIQVTASRALGEGDSAMEKVHEASLSRIDLLHRSVLDFATNDSIGSVLGLRDLPRDSDIILDYFQACLKLVAVCPRGKTTPGSRPTWEYVKCFIENISSNSDLLGTNTCSLLDEMLTLACALSQRETFLSESLRLEDTFYQMTREIQRLTTVELSFFIQCLSNGLFEYVRAGMRRFFGQDDEGYCISRLIRISAGYTIDPDSLDFPALLLKRLRDQLISKRVSSDIRGPKLLLWERKWEGFHCTWVMVRIPLGNREANKNAPLSSITARELWLGYEHSILARFEGRFRREILLLFVEVLSIWDVGVGQKVLFSYYHQLVLFVSPSVFLSPLSKPNNESARLLDETCSPSQRSMYFGWKNPLGDDADDICCHEVPEAVADGILKRWINEGALREDLRDVRYKTGPSPRHVSDEDIDALIEDVWASETIGSWQQLHLLALLRKWQRQRGREGEQTSTDQSPGGSEISLEFDSPELSSEDGER